MSVRLSSLFCVALVASSLHAADTPDKVTFEEHIKPIFRQHCANCHHQGEKKGGLAVDTYGSLIEGGGSGEVVFDDGDVDGSRLWQLVNHDDTPVMPPNQDKLPAEQLALIRKWIEGGILENAGSKARVKKNTAMAFVASTSGKPEGPAAMPVSVPQKVPVVSARASAVTAIATSPWAPLVAIAGQKQIVLYHTETSELLGVLPFQEGIAQDIKFSRDGSYLIVGGGEHSSKGLVAIYDVKTGERIGSVGDELDTVFGADANDTLSRIALGGPQKMLRIFDAASGEMLFDIKKHTDWIYSVAYSPDGILVASGDRAGGLCVWEAETGRLYLDLVGHKGAVHSLSWRADSNVLASASADGTVKLWEMNDGKAIRSINAHGGGVMSVQFDSQGRLATAGVDNRAKLFDGNGKELKNLTLGSEDILEVAISHDGKRLIYGDWAGQIRNTSLEKKEDSVTLAANPEPIEKRVEAVKLTLVSVQEKLTPAKAELDKAMAAVAAAQKPINEMNQKIAELRKAAEQATADAAAAETAVKSLDQKLPGLTHQVRDEQDAMIAMRVALKSDPSKLIATAEAEERLAQKLLEVAKQRRQRVATFASIAQHKAEAARLTGEADKLVAAKPPLEKQLSEKQTLANTAKVAHDQIAQQANQIQSKIDRMLAEIN